MEHWVDREGVRSKFFLVNGQRALVCDPEQMGRYSSALKGRQCQLCAGGLFDGKIDDETRLTCKEVPLDPNDILYEYYRDRQNSDWRLGLMSPPMHVSRCTTCGMLDGPWVPAEYYPGM